MSEQLAVLAQNRLPEFSLPVKDLQEKLSENSIKTLLHLGILNKTYATSWWCDECLKNHDYIEQGMQLYKFCPEDTISDLTILSPSDLAEYRWEHQIFTSHVCDINKLAPIIESKNNENFYPIGSTASIIVFFTHADNPDDIFKEAQSIKAQYKDYDILLIHALPYPIPNPLIEQLNLLNTTCVTLPDLVRANFNLNLTPDVEDELVVMLINPSRKLLIIHGQAYTFKPSEGRFFKTLFIIAMGQGEKVTNAQFESQNYTIPNALTSKGSSSLSKGYISELKKILTKNFASINNIDDLIVTHRGSSAYSIHPDFLPMKIQS